MRDKDVTTLELQWPMTAKRTNGYEFAIAKERLWEGDSQMGNSRYE
jgi:hypothetical protein